MLDYSEIVDAAQRELAQRCTLDPSVLNVPGLSLACKIDPYYYLGLHPGFVDRLAVWRTLKPATLRTALIKTGNLVTGAPGSRESLRLSLSWSEGARRGTFETCFLHSSFIDRAMTLYGPGRELPISPLRIAASERGRVETFLGGKTPVESLAYQADD